MPLVWSLLLISLVKNILLQLILVFIICLLTKRNDLIILSIIMSVSLLNFTPPETIKGKVVSISDYSFVVRDKIHYYRIKESYQGTLDDSIKLENLSFSNTKNGRDYARRINRVIDKSEISVISKGMTVRSKLWDKLKETKFRRAVIFNEYLEEFPMISSLSMQLSGILMIFRYLLRYRAHKIRIKKIEIGVVITYGLIFGFSFGVIRILMGCFKIDRVKQMLGFLVFFPGVGIYLGFIYPYCTDLLKGISYRFENVNSFFIYPILMSLVNYRVIVTELIFFKVQRLICGLLLLLSFVSWFEGISIFIAEKFFLFLNLNHRLIVLGKYSLPLVLFVVLVYYFGHKRTSYCVWVMGFVLCVYPLGWRVHFIDVGQGDTTLIQAPFNAYSILIDTGHPRAQAKLIKSLNRYSASRIDSLIITHDDLDHSGNVTSIKNRVVNLVDTKGTLVPFMKSYLDDKNYSEANDNSLIYSFDSKRLSFMFMGDAGIVQERDIINSDHNLKIDVLKLGHHGSRTSSSEHFLSTLQPSYAIVSADSRMYGHPHIEVLQSLYRFRIRPLLTEASGDISFVSGILFDYLRTDALGFGIIR